MLPDQKVLTRFLKAGMNFFFYGPQGSGKTTLLKDSFKHAEADYLYINCNLAYNKTNFFRSLNNEFDQFIRKTLIKNRLDSRESQVIYVRSEIALNTIQWIKKIQNLSSQVKKLIPKIYLFIDSVQKIQYAQSFLTQLCSACQSNKLGLKISFVLCSSKMDKKWQQSNQLFRNITTFCMNNPTNLMLKIINQICIKAFWYTRWYPQLSLIRKRSTAQDIEKASQVLAKLIYSDFAPIQSNLNKIKIMTVNLVSEICSQIQQQLYDNQHKEKRSLFSRITAMINSGLIKQYTNLMQQHGPMQDYEIRRKLSPIQEIYATELPYEYYPQLLLTSLHLADQGPQNEDFIRFKDFPQDKIKQKVNNVDFFQKSPIQRVIAISEALQSSGQQGGIQSDLSHHSILFYGCFEFLREEGKINFTKGDSIQFTKTKIYGNTNQEEAEYFLKKKLHLKYHNFVRSNYF